LFFSVGAIAGALAKVQLLTQVRLVLAAMQFVEMQLVALELGEVRLPPQSTTADLHDAIIGGEFLPTIVKPKFTDLKEQSEKADANFWISHLLGAAGIGIALLAIAAAL